MPFEIPSLPADTLTVDTGCVLGYHTEAETWIHLLIRHTPEFAPYVAAESTTHDRGAAIEWLTDAHGNTVLRTRLLPGMNTIRSSATFRMPPRAEPRKRSVTQESLLPYHAVRYAFPSRYCESDKLAGFASQLFGPAASTWDRVQDICDWTHKRIEYRHTSGDPTLSAMEAMSRGYGVCRDFAHVMIALCRALDIPARYAAGHIPLIGEAAPGSDIGIDFHAYVEVFIEGQWHVFDPRHNRHDYIRIKLAHGMDAVDTAIASFHGAVTPVGFEVWAHAAGR